MFMLGQSWAAEVVRFMDFFGPGNMLVRVAINKGYCAKQGLDCQLKMIASGPLGVQAMMAGTIDAAPVPVDVIIGAIKNGTPMKMVAGSMISNLLVLVERRDGDAPADWKQSVRALKGKKIGVIARGSSSETGMRFLMKSAGLNPDDATYIGTGGVVTAYNALTSNQVDAAMSIEPVASICIVSKTCRVLWRGSVDKEPADLYSLNGASNGLVFMQSTIDKKPEMIAAVIRAVSEADKFINDPKNFDEVVKIAESYYKFDLPNGHEVMQTNIRQFVQDRTYSAAIDRAAIKGALAYLKASNIDTGTVGVNDLVYSKAP
jgi:NitT/TauT family transport system substrate-binding protein